MTHVAVALIVVGDENEQDSHVVHLLNTSSVESAYIAAGRTKNYYREQKTAGINELIRVFDDDTVIYMATHDHFWHPNLWDEIRKVKRVGIIPLGNSSKDPGGCERPIFLADGTIYAWFAAYSGRRYPVNTGAWAVHRSLLGNEPKDWWPADRGNDSAFIAKLIPDRSHLDSICDGCNFVYAWQSIKLDDPIGKGVYPRLDLPRFELVERGDWKS